MATALTYLPPAELLKAKPCLSCLSEHELMAVLVLALAQKNDTYANNLPKLMTDSVCYTCMSKKQLLEAFTAMVVNQALNGKTTSQLVALTKCIRCAKPQQLRAALVYLIGASFQTAL